MAWRRFGFGMSRKSALELKQRLEKEGDKAKITKTSIGYSVLMWVDLEGKYKGLKPRR